MGEQASIARRVKRLMAEQCVNHANEQNGIHDYCCLERTPGYRCAYVVDDAARCNYFETSVLPVDRELEALYHADRKARADGYDLTRLQVAATLEPIKRPPVTCARCGKSFEAASNRQKYCPSCRRAVTNEQKRVSKKRPSITTGEGER